MMFSCNSYHKPRGSFSDCDKLQHVTTAERIIHNAVLSETVTTRNQWDSIEKPSGYQAMAMVDPIASLLVMFDGKPEVSYLFLCSPIAI